MSTNLERFKSELSRLVETGDALVAEVSLRLPGMITPTDKELQETAKKIHGSFEKMYQKWYTEAYAVIKQLLPDRLEEFVHLYKGDTKRKQINGMTYRIQDWLNGIRSGEDPLGRKSFDDLAFVSMLFKTQVEVLRSVESRFESSLHNISQMVRADLFDSELDAAHDLAKNGFLRAAGAVAGVVLEKHLGQVAASHTVDTKKHPTISELNDLLKNASVLDIPTWRQIQRLGDLRNLCDHNKGREPTKEEVIELIDGVGKTSKNVF